MSDKETTVQAAGSDDYRPGLEGVVASRSSISFVDGANGVLEYRGINIRDLVDHSTFEETVYLLLYNHLPTQRELAQFTTLMSKQRILPYAVREAINNFPVTMHPMIALQAGITLLAGDDYSFDEVGNQIHNIRRAVSLIAKAPSIIAAFERRRHGEEPLPAVSKFNHAENFLFMMNGERPHPEEAGVFDKMLIMHADHSTNASTFACRVIGSTLGNLYSSVSGAVGALSGPLHGGANERVLRMLFSVGSPENVETFVDEMMAAGNKIMGIGHRIYKVKDPRAELLQAMIPRLLALKGGAEMQNLFDTAVRLEETVNARLSHKKLYPNVDFYSGIALEMLKIPMDLFTPMFAMSRISGWCAHWVEQVSANRLFRPKQEYIGDHNRPYVPIDRR
jgi:citrate synthase